MQRNENTKMIRQGDRGAGGGGERGSREGEERERAGRGRGWQGRRGWCADVLEVSTL